MSWERLDLSRFEQAYGAEGGALYAPELMLGVWLYAYAPFTLYLHVLLTKLFALGASCSFRGLGVL
jgi:hypothetical protein